MCMYICLVYIHVYIHISIYLYMYVWRSLRRVPGAACGTVPGLPYQEAHGALGLLLARAWGAHEELGELGPGILLGVAARYKIIYVHIYIYIRLYLSIYVQICTDMISIFYTTPFF